MTQPFSNHRVVRFPEALDFEPTDLQSARDALDTLPPGVERIPDFVPDYWVRKRRKPTATDRAMTGDAMAWVLNLPAWLRPKALCDRYPRVANNLAASWSNPATRHETLSDLLHDRRGGRRGFPPDVRGEIEALWRELHPPTHPLNR